MINNNIIIGKHTLESLTKGMYYDAKVIYREYIQNSVDAIEKAIRNGIINRNEAEINIRIDKDKSEILIKDNGIGISSKIAVKKLLDIGNSSKDPKDTIGFRGIGRLAGLGYCKKLLFITSYKGENNKTIVIFDAKKLEKLLIPGAYQDYNLLDVINEITNYRVEEEEKGEHYFKVILEKVGNYDHILDYEIIKKYLSQIAPVPFDKNLFSWSSDIKDKFKLEGLNIKEYKIQISTNDKRGILYKMNSDEFVTDIRRKSKDYIKNIKIEVIKDENGKPIAFLWYTISNFYGTIVNREKKGIRLRKGNIQIGDRSTLNSIFKEDRFNGWFQGEVYVLDDNIIPNARRDNFEKNKEYEKLIEKLKIIGDKLSKKIRKISNERSKEKNIKKMYKKLNYLSGKIEDSCEYKALGIRDNLTQQEKEVLDKVFSIVDDNYKKEELNGFMEKILSNY